MDTTLMVAGVIATVALSLLSLMRLVGVISMSTEKAIAAGLIVVILLTIILSRLRRIH